MKDKMDVRLINENKIAAAIIIGAVIIAAAIIAVGASDPLNSLYDIFH
jgi:hypothetical protein